MGSVPHPGRLPSGKGRGSGPGRGRASDRPQALQEREAKKGEKKRLEEALEAEQSREPETERKSGELALIRNELQEYEKLDGIQAGLAKAESGQQIKLKEMESLKESSAKLK